MKTCTKREGIALIAVLGFLSILILMAIAFLMNTRTERLVAETAKDDVQVRQFLHTALASAMDDVDDLMNNYNNLVKGARSFAPTNMPRPVNIRLPTNAVIVQSESSGLYTNLGADVCLISGAVTNWLPRRYLSSEDDPYNATGQAATTEWIFLHDPNPLPGQPTNILGRYAYLVFDCTGMMDANLFTHPVTRGEGKSVAEVDAAFLPEVTSAQAFNNNLGNYSRFGNFPEILFLNQDALSVLDVNHLMPYSLCYDAGWWNWTSTNWMIKGADGAPLNITKWSSNDAFNVFTNLVFPKAGEMAACFVDYVDDDFLPGTSNDVPNPDIVCGESIPMINEVAFAGCELRLAGSKLTYTHVFEIELWFPFPTEDDNDHTYTVNMNTYVGDIIAKAGSADITLIATNASITCVPSITPDPSFPFMVVTARCSNYSYTFPTGPASNDFPIRVRTKSISEVTNLFMTDDTVNPKQVVDTANLPPNDSRNVGGEFDTRLDGEGSDKRMKRLPLKAAIDPRLNHLTSDWDKPLNATIGSINAMAGGSVGLSSTGDREGTTCYVANRGMSNVAELGFIPTGLPWTTIDLFSSEGKELLTKFRMTNIVEGEKVYTNGFINPNTLLTNVLLAAFRDAPIEEYPGDSSPQKVSSGMAGDIVNGMYEILNSATIYGSNVFDSSAAWVTTRAFKVGGTLSRTPGPYQLDNNQKESIIRNTYRLFNPNQNLFTIVVIAQAINDQGNLGEWDGEETDIITGEKRAVALVWRDPFPDASTGRHEMFVRLFKYLDE